jgi:hypothetical protein
MQVARRECDIPNLVVVARAGAGKTTLLRYLQQTADTVRYGAELQADTNWVVKGWTSAPCSSVTKDAVQPVLPVPRFAKSSWASPRSKGVT